MTNSERNKQWLWGAVGGAIALSMVTLSWDIWVTQGAAQRMARAQADIAVAQALAPLRQFGGDLALFVAQFTQPHQGGVDAGNGRMRRLAVGCDNPAQQVDYIGPFGRDYLI